MTEPAGCGIIRAPGIAQPEEEPKMANKISISLTEDQQKQISDATGRTITTLNLDPSQLTEKDLDQVVGGAIDAFIWFESPRP